MKKLVVGLVLAMGGTALAEENIVRIETDGRIIRKWQGGIWPGDGKQYPAGSFEYYDPKERAVQPAQPAGQPAAPAPVPIAANPGDDALDEVNATRAQRGLRPFMKDQALTQAAAGAARYRAANGISGHTQNDFAFVPPGSFARSAGCAAWPLGMGWGSCCTYDGYQFAGAGWAVGRDGKRYMHLFVR